MKFCCRDMAKMIRDGNAKIGNALEDPYGKPYLAYIEINGEPIRFCPICGMKITIEFEGDEDNEQ